MKKTILTIILATLFILTACAEGNVLGQAITAEEREAGFFGLQEGETITRTIQGVDFEITAVNIGRTARFAVNGELSNPIQIRGSHEFENGAVIRVLEIPNADFVRGHIHAIIQPEPPSNEVTDILREGETKDYTLRGENFEVTAAFIDARRARFSINGEMTRSLRVGQYQPVGQTVITVREIMTHGRDALVEFRLEYIMEEPPIPEPPRPIPNNVDEDNFGEVFESRLYKVQGIENFSTNQTHHLGIYDAQINCEEGDVIVWAGCSGFYLEQGNTAYNPAIVVQSMGPASRNLGETTCRGVIEEPAFDEWQIRGDAVCLKVN